MLAHLVVISTRGTGRQSVPAAQAAKPAGRPRPIPPPGSRGTRQAVCESRARTCLPPPFIPEIRANQCWFLLPSKRSTSARHPRCCESQRRGEWLHTVSPSGEDGDLAIRLSSTKRIGEGLRLRYHFPERFPCDEAMGTGRAGQRAVLVQLMRFARRSAIRYALP